MGMAGYYREFCPNFASVGAPLADLFKADINFLWSCLCQPAFHQLKDLLSSAPEPATPQLDCPFKLQADACDAGAVLLQDDQKGGERPVGYFFKEIERVTIQLSRKKPSLEC